MGCVLFVERFREGFFVSCSSKKADTGINLYFIQMKLTDPEQRSTTDPKVNRFSCYYIYNPGTINKHFYLLMFCFLYSPLFVNQTGKF